MRAELSADIVVLDGTEGLLQRGEHRPGVPFAVIGSVPSRSATRRRNSSGEALRAARRQTNAGRVGSGAAEGARPVVLAVPSGVVADVSD